MADLHLTPVEVNAVLGDIEEALKLSNGIMEELGDVMKTLGTC